MLSVRRKLIETINLKLTDHSTSYNARICKLCDELIENINIEINDIFVLNYNALKVTLPFESNDPLCDYRCESNVTVSRDNLRLLHIELERHLIFLDVEIVPYVEKYYRFNKLVASICETIKTILEYDFDDRFMILYNNIIKYNCLSLFEVTEWRLANHYVKWYDVLMEFIGLSLKAILQLQIANFDTCFKAGYCKFIPKKLQQEPFNILKMHRGLLNEISKYLE